MEFKPARCPKCDGELQLPLEKEKVNCMYCGVEIEIKNVINKSNIHNNQINPGSMLLYANSLLKSKQYGEAIKTYGKILENNFDDINALKGMAITLLETNQAEKSLHYIEILNNKGANIDEINDKLHNVFKNYSITYYGWHAKDFFLEINELNLVYEYLLKNDKYKNSSLTLIVDKLLKLVDEYLTIPDEYHFIESFIQDYLKMIEIVSKYKSHPSYQNIRSKIANKFLLCTTNEKFNHSIGTLGFKEGHYEKILNFIISIFQEEINGILQIELENKNRVLNLIGKITEHYYSTNDRWIGKDQNNPVCIKIIEICKYLNFDIKKFKRSFFS